VRYNRIGAIIAFASGVALHPPEKPKHSDGDPVWISIGGSIELGEIDGMTAAALGVPAGPIRIAEGFGGPKGYGYLHIKGYDSRVGQLLDIGFSSLEHCLSEVATNWTYIVADNDSGRLGLILPVNRPDHG
jgi:hypothetical protein